MYKMMINQNNCLQKSWYPQFCRQFFWFLFSLSENLTYKNDEIPISVGKKESPNVFSKKIQPTKYGLWMFL